MNEAELHHDLGSYPANAWQLYHAQTQQQAVDAIFEQQHKKED